jgi:YidC/Oxa1 family membrane protein insertase
MTRAKFPKRLPLAVVGLLALLVPGHAFRVSPKIKLSNRLTRRGVAEHVDAISTLLSHPFPHDWFSHGGFIVADEGSATTTVATAGPISPYAKVDKEGFIGGLAAGIETAIDFGHKVLEGMGLKNTYGYSIILFTCLVKAATLPLTSAQLESTSKLQALAPLQAKIQAKYANDENTKNQLAAMLFQAANVNPLAGCLPALVQLPVFLSLYRALGNMVAENKLGEPFLWIPDLEGPVYVNTEQTVESSNWLMSIFTGSPSLGWPDTLAFLSLPLILFVSQTISQKVLTPPRDPSKPMTEQEEVSQGIINNLPFIVAFFSVNVPAGLGVYWCFNNFITTAITLVLKARFKDTQLPAAVDELMAQIDSNSVQVPPAMAAMGPNPFSRQSDDFSSSSPSSTSFSSSAGSPAVIDAEVVDPGTDETVKRELTKEEALIEEMKRMNVLAKEMLKKKGDQGP